MELEIETQDPVKVEDALNIMCENVRARAKGTATAIYKKIGTYAFRVEMNSIGENRATNWILKKEFKKAMKKIDPKIKIKG